MTIALFIRRIHRRIRIGRSGYGMVDCVYGTLLTTLYSLHTGQDN